MVLQNLEILHLQIIDVTVVAFCDFIAQSILVRPTGNTYHYYSSNSSKDISLLDCVGLQYSCCDRSIILSIRILRSINYLHSLTDFNLWFLAIWIVGGTAPLSIVQGQINVPKWSGILAIAGLALSMTVNALVTGLIVFRIFKVFQEVKTGTTDEQILGVTGGSTFRRVIFIIIESGMALFSIQLARLVVIIVSTDAFYGAFELIIGIHEMLNVIITSAIVRVILLITLASLGYNTYHYLGTGVNGIILLRREFDGGS